MLYHLNYQPFSYFWQNCQLNNVLSVLTSLEPSYKLAAFLNDYNYTMIKTPIDEDTFVYSLDLNYKDGIKKYIEDILIYKKTILPDQDNKWQKILKIDEYYFKNNSMFLEEVQKLIKNNKAVSVGVNLFYWVEGSISYEKYQYNHYALITGYDDKKLEYYTFDDDLYSYKSHVIPDERFRIAFSNSVFKEPPAFVVTVCENIEPYKLNINDVVNCANAIKENITSIDISDFWTIHFSSADKFSEAADNCIIKANRISNRHIGNKLLFEALYTLGIVKNKAVTDKYIKIEDELIEGWIEVKNIIAMCKYSGKNHLSTETLNKLNKRLLEKEYIMWNELSIEFKK